jgi:hypothetical protein
VLGVLVLLAAGAVHGQVCGPYLDHSAVEEQFLFGVSYYGALSVIGETRLVDDLNLFRSRGFNNIRVWGNWTVTGAANATLFDASGNLLGTSTSGPKFRMHRLLNRAAEEPRPLIVDLTFSWRSFCKETCGLPQATCKPNLAPTCWAGFNTGLENVANEFANHANFFIDVANEHNSGQTAISTAAVEDLSDSVFLGDSQRNVTVSAVCPDPEKDTGQVCASDTESRYNTLLGLGAIQFVTPHFDRTDDWAAETAGRVSGLRGALNFTTPIHLQEENRWEDEMGGTSNPCTTHCQPEDFWTALGGAATAGAAGWVFHTAAGFELHVGSGSFYSRLRGSEPATIDCTESTANTTDCLLEKLNLNRCQPPPLIFDSFDFFDPNGNLSAVPNTAFPERLRHYATDVGSGDWRVRPNSGLVKLVLGSDVVVTSNNDANPKTGVAPFALPAGFSGVAEVKATVACGDIDAAATGIQLGFTSNADELPTDFNGAGSLRLVHSCGNVMYLYGPGGVLLGSHNPPGYFGQPRALRLQYDAGSSSAQVWLDGNVMSGLSVTVPAPPDIAAAGFQIDYGEPGQVWVDDFEVAFSP